MAATENFLILESIVKTEKQGSVRVDLLGGTLDLPPLDLILPNAMTLNLATTLKAKVVIESTDRDGVTFVSKDYDMEQSFPASDFTEEKFRSNHFGPLMFVARIMHLGKLTTGVRVSLQSGSPAGAGLGGSSTMGVTLLSAICDHTGVDKTRQEMISTVRNIESLILNSGPAGYQDYYPALYGGILALRPSVEGVEVSQLYSPELANFLEQNMTLVYSGETRLSGINNWEVYKSFFDKDAKVIAGLEAIANLTTEAYESIINKDLTKLSSLIGREGEIRCGLFPGILSDSIKNLYNKLSESVDGLGLKVCGAGGGGCFLLIHEPAHKSLVQNSVRDAGMSELEFSVSAPI